MKINPTFRVLVPDGGIPDPYGGNSEIYREVYEQQTNGGGEDE